MGSKQSIVVPPQYYLKKKQFQCKKIVKKFRRFVDFLIFTAKYRDDLDQFKKN